LASARGFAITAVVRPETTFDLPGVGVVRGDVMDEGFLRNALHGHQAVVSCLGLRRASQSNPWSKVVSPANLCARVSDVLRHAAREAGVRRVLAISAAGVGDSRAQVSGIIRWMIGHSKLRVSYDDLERMENNLRESGLEWAAVRPVTLSGGAPTDAVRVVQRYGMTSKIRRADVAGFLVRLLESSDMGLVRTPMIAGG
jgi:putative NADH-flavin reductase